MQSRPTDPPLVTAANESWYQQREPVQFAGDLYYPAGPAVFFNGNVMVRTGHYNGVPLYADTTVEPFSVILVPVSRGLMQPYERPRRGDLAGTTGSRTPSFPAQLTPTGAGLPAAPGAPTGAPMTIGAIGVFTPEPAAAPGRDTVATTGITAPPAPLVTLRRPEGNDGIWVAYRGQKWISAGPSVPLTEDLRRVGVYGTAPVFAPAGAGDVIYLPTARAGQVAPYRLKQ